MAKLVFSWDIRRGKTREYVEFTVSEFFPALARHGLTINEVWGTLMGSGPQVLIAGSVASVAEARQLLESSEYAALRERLDQYILNYQARVRN